MYIKALLLYAICACSTIDSARILAIVPSASYSHQVYFRPFWKELANRGHEVVLITTDPIKDSSIRNLKEIDISEAYILWNNSLMNILNSNSFGLTKFKDIWDIGYDIARLQLSNPEVQSLYHNQNEHFDLLIMEYNVPTMFPFIHKFNVPFIGISSEDVNNLGHIAVGNAIHSILYPSYYLAMSDELSFFDRLKSTLLDTYLLYWNHYDMSPTFNKMFKEYLGDGIPCILELMYEVDMIFTNANPVFNAIRPFSPATVTLAGGFHEVELQPLPKELEEFLNNATQGVIYFSLGSSIKSKEIKSETRQIIMNTFAQMPYQVLWKFEDDELPGKPENVKIVKWVPQSHVLRHKNILVFVTQGGLQSLEESLHAGVPMVAMPFYTDQEGNARHVRLKGLGLQVDHETLTVDGFKEALLEVINNESYRQKVNEAANWLFDQPMKPLEKAVWWTEYVIRHKGAKHLHSPIIPFYQYFYLDFVWFLISVCVVIVLTVYWILKKIVGCCWKFYLLMVQDITTKQKKM